MMLLKCCTQYVGKFRKLSSGHRTGKVQFSLQSQRRAMPKNVQTTSQLHSFHTLATLCSISPKLGFTSMWTKNLQMYKLGNKEEPEIKLPTFAGSWRMQGSSKKTSTCFIDYIKTFDCVDYNKLWKILRDGNTRSLYLSPEKPVCRSRSKRTRHGTTDWFTLGKGVRQNCIFSSCLFNIYTQYIMQNTSLEHKLQSKLPKEI